MPGTANHPTLFPSMPLPGAQIGAAVEKRRHDPLARARGLQGHATRQARAKAILRGPYALAAHQDRRQVGAVVSASGVLIAWVLRDQNMQEHIAWYHPEDEGLPAWNPVSRRYLVRGYVEIVRDELEPGSEMKRYLRCARLVYHFAYARAAGIDVEAEAERLEALRED